MVRRAASDARGQANDTAGSWASPALAVGVAAVLLAGTVLPAHAWGPMTWEGYEAARWSRQYQYRGPARPWIDRPFLDRRVRKAIAKKPGTSKPTKNESALAAPSGPLQIIVSIASQRVTVYSSGVAIAEAPVSSGTDSHPTPTGVFSIIAKSRFHRSNIYSNAPMPFMQRLTWSGVALHEGVLPGYPASHGCIRLPRAFAHKLWGMTKLGARVIVAPSDVRPAEIIHPALFVPGRKSIELRRSIADVPARAEPAVPVIVRVSDVVKTADAAASTSDAMSALDEPYRGSARKLRPAKSERADTAKAPPLRSGPVSVFVSRKEGRLFVRKGFDTVFDMAVTIRNPGQPLGTHVFTAVELTNGGTGVRWTAISMPDEALGRKAEAPAGHVKLAAQRARGKDVTDLADAHGSAAAHEALDRIEMPAEAIERISAMLSPGASLIISDQGRGSETGLETDFIVLTR
jgi:lipoprotein-anchoring transpeptidase ErfK/SrfK